MFYYEIKYLTENEATEIYGVHADNFTHAVFYAQNNAKKGWVIIGILEGGF